MKIKEIMHVALSTVSSRKHMVLFSHCPQKSQTSRNVNIAVK